MVRLGLLKLDGQGDYGPFQTPPDPGDPTDPPPDPPDPPVDPGALAHGSLVTTANTGPAGLGIAGSLTSGGAGMETSSHGQEIYAKSFTGPIKVSHNNVTIRGCKIQAPIGTHVIQPYNGCYGLKVEWCEILQSPTQGGDRNGVSGIYNVPLGRERNSIYRCNIHDTSDGAKLSGGWQIVESHIQFTQIYGSTHNDGIQSQKSTNAHDPSVIVRRCKIIMGPNFGNAAVFVTAEGGDQYNVLIEDNWLQCSNKSHGVAVHGQDNIGQWLGNVTIKGNKVVQGWNGGPESNFSLVAVPGGQVPRTGNREVNVSGDDLGPA